MWGTKKVRVVKIAHAHLGCTVTDQLPNALYKESKIKHVQILTNVPIISFALKIIYANPIYP